MKYHKHIFTFLVCFIVIVAFSINNTFAVTTENVIPAYSASCVIISDVSKIASFMENSPVWQKIGKYAKEQVKKNAFSQSFFQKLLINNIWSLISPSINQIAIVAIDPSKMDSQTIIVDLSNSMNLFGTAQKIIQILAGEKKSEIVPNAGTYQGISYGIVKPESRFAFLENLLIFAPSQKEFEAVINVYKDKEPSIVADPKYISSSNKVFNNGQMFLYFNSEMASSVSRFMNQQEQLKTLGIGSIKAISWSIDILSSTRDQELYFFTGDDQRLLSYLLSTQSNAISPHIIPASNSDLFFVITANDIASAWDEYLEQLKNSLEIEQYYRMQDALSNLEMIFGLDFKDDIISSMTGEFGFSISIPESEEVSFSPTSGMFLFLGIKEPEKFQLVIERLLADKGLEKAQYKNVDIFYIRPMNSPDGPFGYTFAGDLLVFSGIKNLMAIIDNETPLIASERFSAIGSKLPQSYGMLFYIDLSKLMAFRPPRFDQDQESWIDIMQSLGSIGGCSVYDGQGYGMKILGDQGKSWLDIIGNMVLNSAELESSAVGGMK